MWRGHGGGDGAVLGARSAHFSAEKGLMSGKGGPSSSRTVVAELQLAQPSLGKMAVKEPAQPFWCYIPRLAAPEAGGPDHFCSDDARRDAP